MMSTDDKTLLLMMGNAGSYLRCKEFIINSLPKLHGIFGENLSVGIGDTRLGQINLSKGLMYFINRDLDLFDPELDWCFKFNMGGGTDGTQVLSDVANDKNHDFKNVIFVMGSYALVSTSANLPVEWIKSRNVMAFCYNFDEHEETIQKHQEKFGHLFFNGTIESTNKFDDFLAVLKLSQ